MGWNWFLFSIGFYFIMPACSPDEQPHAPRAWSDPGLVNLSRPWESQPAATFDISNSIVASALEKGKKVKGLESAVIIKNGKLIGEKYFSGQTNTLRHIRSGTKSIMGILTGMANQAQSQVKPSLITWSIPW